MSENTIKDFGVYIREKYAHKFVNIDNRKQKGICAFRNCKNEYDIVYCGVPLCDKHHLWVEEKIEKTYPNEE